MSLVEPAAPPQGFSVHLDNFEGPFDLLLQLISRHELDISDVALSRVTDDFVAHLTSLGADWQLDPTTGFLVIASTLLDLKVVRLLPTAEVEDEGDLALLEARDLLFARLLQYRAFKRAAAVMAARMEAESGRVPRSVTLEERFASALPEVLLTLGPEELARLAARALAPREPPVMGLEHLHRTTVSVSEQASTIVVRLRRSGGATFRSLVSDSPDTLTTVARFLALLELFRDGVVAFEQVSAFGELSIRWTGTDADAGTDGPDEVTARGGYDDYDEYDAMEAGRAVADAPPPAESVTDADVARLSDALGGDGGDPR